MSIPRRLAAGLAFVTAVTLPNAALAQMGAGVAPAVTVSFLPVQGGTTGVIGARLGLLRFDSGPVVYGLMAQWWGPARSTVEEPPVLSLGVVANFRPIRRDPYRSTRTLGHRNWLFFGVGPMVLGRKQPDGVLKLRPAGEVELGVTLRPGRCCAVALSGQGHMDWQGAVLGLSGALWLGRAPPQ